MPSMTPKQAEVLEAIRRHISLTGQSPTVREIGQSVQLKSSCSVQKHLDSLERLGKIRRSSFKYRSIEIADDTCIETAGSVLVPLLGSAPRTPSTSDPEFLSLPERLLPRVERRSQSDACASRNYESAPLFALTVKGDSMSAAGIDSGDIVVARRQRAAENGDIIVAAGAGTEEATVKRFYRAGTRADMPSEPSAAGDMQIVGKVAMAIKCF